MLKIILLADKLKLKYQITIISLEYSGYSFFLGFAMESRIEVSAMTFFIL